MDEFDYDDWETPGNDDDTTEVVDVPESELPLPETLPPDEVQEALEAATVYHVISDEGDDGEVVAIEAGAATPPGVVPQWAPPEVHISTNRWDDSSKSVTKMTTTDWAQNENGGGGITGVQGSSDA